MIPIVGQIGGDDEREASGDRLRRMLGHTQGAAQIDAAERIPNSCAAPSPPRPRTAVRFVPRAARGNAPPALTAACAALQSFQAERAETWPEFTGPARADERPMAMSAAVMGRAAVENFRPLRSWAGSEAHRSGTEGISTQHPLCRRVSGIGHQSEAGRTIRRADICWCRVLPPGEMTPRIHADRDHVTRQAIVHVYQIHPSWPHLSSTLPINSANANSQLGSRSCIAKPRSGPE